MEILEGKVRIFFCQCVPPSYIPALQQRKEGRKGGDVGLQPESSSASSPQAGTRQLALDSRVKGKVSSLIPIIYGGGGSEPF